MGPGVLRSPHHVVASATLFGFRISVSSWVFQAWTRYSRTRGASHVPGRGEQQFPWSCSLCVLVQLSFAAVQGLPADSSSTGTQNSSAELLLRRSVPSPSLSCSCSSEIPSQSLLSTITSHWNRCCGVQVSFLKKAAGKNTSCNWGQIFSKHVVPLVVEQQNQSLSWAHWLCSFPAQPVDMGSDVIVCAKKTCKHWDGCFTFKSLINQNHL